MKKEIDIYDVIEYILNMDREEDADIGIGRYRIFRGTKDFCILRYDPKRNIDSEEFFPLTDEGQGEATARFVQLTGAA